MKDFKNTKLQVNQNTNSNNIAVFKDGMRDGLPIALGYLAVSFSLGIAAKNAGLTPFQGFIASLLTNASAGEYAGFTVISAGASYLEMALVILIANSRYMIMSCALSQKMNPKTPWYHRVLIGFDITDELFAITIARSGMINPYYFYGAMFLALPGWSLGTLFGVIAGNLLPINAVSAFSVALYGMFLAVIIPPSRKNKIIGIFVLISFIASYTSVYLPYLSEMSGATRTIILTLLISTIAAVFFPIKSQGAEN